MFASNGAVAARIATGEKRRRRRLRVVFNYAIAVLAPVAALGLSVAIGRPDDHAMVFLFLGVAVVAAACRGFGPAMVGILIALAAGPGWVSRHGGFGVPDAAVLTAFAVGTAASVCVWRPSGASGPPARASCWPARRTCNRFSIPCRK